MVKTIGVRGSTLARFALVLVLLSIGNTPALRVAGFTDAPVLEADGEPSTWFPPERLAELTRHIRGMRMLSNGFLMKNFRFSKNLKNVIFLNFYRQTAVTSDLTSIEEINK